MSSDWRELSHQSFQFFDAQSRIIPIALKSNFGLHARLVSALVAGELLGLEQKRTTTRRWLSTTTRLPTNSSPLGCRAGAGTISRNKTDIIPSMSWEKRGDRLWQRYVDCCLVVCSVPLVVVGGEGRSELTSAEMRYDHEILKPVQSS